MLIEQPGRMGPFLLKNRIIMAPIRECISCNVCFERLTLELDVCCVQNPMVGTEFESLRFAEPHLDAAQAPREKRRVLVLGAGVAGAEAARTAAAQGQPGLPSAAANGVPPSSVTLALRVYDSGSAVFGRGRSCGHAGCL